MINIVELITDQDEQSLAPCKFGNIVEGHACYCHADDWEQGPRKCPIWRRFGLRPEKWHKRDWVPVELPMWDGKTYGEDGHPLGINKMWPCMPDDDIGGCPHFIARENSND